METALVVAYIISGLVAVGIIFAGFGLTRAMTVLGEKDDNGD